MLILVGLGWLMVRGFGSSPSNKTYRIDDPNAPKIEISEKTFDFGKINVKDVPTHEFKLKNTGKSELLIADITTSCHCTSAYFKIGEVKSPEFQMTPDKSWQGKIPPGQEGVIDVVYTPSKMPVTGSVNRTISFTSNDPSSHENQLQIIADVQN